MLPQSKTKKHNCEQQTGPKNPFTPENQIFTPILVKFFISFPAILFLFFPQKRLRCRQKVS
jgi:hypothetical protein